MAALRELLAILDIQVNDKELKQAHKDIDSGIESLKKFGETAKTVALVVGGTLVAGFAALGASIVSATNHLDDMQDTADKLGIYVEKLQEYNYAADRAGSSSENFQLLLTKISDNAIEASDSSSTAAKAYKTLGIELKNSAGEAKTSVEVFDELHAAYNSGNEKKQAQVNKLLGGTFAKNLPIFRKSVEEFGALKQRSEEVGKATSEQTAIAGNLKDSWDDVFMSLKQVGYVLVQIFGPGLTTVAGLIFDLINDIKEFIGVTNDNNLDSWADSIEQAILKAYIAVLDFALGVKQAIQDVQKWFKEHQTTVEFLASILAGILVVATALWVKQLYLAAAAWVKVAAAELIAAAPIILVTALIGLLIFAIYEVYKNWDKISKFFITTADLIWSKIKWLIDQVIAGFNSLSNTIFDIGNSIVNYFTGVWNKITSGLTSAFNSAFETVKKIVAKIMNLPGVGAVIGVVKGAANIASAPFKAGSADVGPRGMGTQNVNQTNTSTVGTININGAGDPKAVADRVVQTMTPGGNAATRNAMQTNKII